MRQVIEEDVDHRRGVEGEHLAQQQDLQPWRMPSGRRSSDPMPVPNRQRDSTQKRGHGGHHDGAKAQQAGLVNRLGRVHAPLPFTFQGEVDHHDAVLFHDADQQDDADDRHHAQILVKQNERQQRAHAQPKAGWKES